MKTILESEVKVKAGKNPEKKLEDLGATKKTERHQKDIYYDHPDKVLRIREEDGKKILTLKEFRESGETKLRKEMEAECKGELEEIVQGLGYEPEYFKEKERKEYEFNGATVCVDEVKKLGKYLEIEVMAEDREEAEERIRDTLQKLGVSPEKTIKKSYIELLGDEKEEKPWK